MMTQRWWSAIALLVIFAMLIGACAAPTTLAPAEAEPAAAEPAVGEEPAAGMGEPVELRLMTWHGSTQKEIIDEMLQAYSETHPNVTVVQESVTGGAGPFLEKLQTAMLAGDAPDVFYMWGGELAGSFIDAGRVVPLDQYYPDYNWNDILTPWVFGLIERDGQLWGVPRAARAMTFWYRTDIFDELGLTPPETYAEFEEVNAQLKEAGIYPISFGGKFGWHPMRLLDYLLEVACGPEKHDQLNALEVSWEDACVVEAYDLFQKWVEQEWITPGFLGVAPADAQIPLYQGEAAMMLETNGFESQVKANEQDPANYDFFIGPTGHEPVRISGYPHQLMIWEGSENVDEALEFINWYVQPEQQQEWYAGLEGTATIGVKPDAAEWPTSAKWADTLPEIEDVFPPTDQAFDPELIGKFFEVQTSVITGDLSPEEAATGFQAAIEDWKAQREQ